MLTVNAQTIDPAAITAEISHLKPKYDHYMQQQGQTPDYDKLNEWARESVIERVLLEQEAAKLEVPSQNDTAEPDSATDSDQKKLQSQMQQLIGSVVASVPAPTQDELQDAYKANAQHFKTPEQVHAAHIVKHTKDGASDSEAYREMLNICERIRKGESFEDLASEHSDCSDNADLGTFPREQMVQEFDDVIFAMEPGDVSEVFQTPFGYHIAKLYEKIDETIVPLSEVQDKLAAHLSDGQKNKAVEAFIDTLKQKATIEDDEA